MYNKVLKTRVMTAFAEDGVLLNRSGKAFTLAETMIVLVILGVVAAITVPALVNRHVEAERKTKLRKAMSVYDAALNKMVIENGIKSDTALTNWADSNTKNDCANTSAYFKVSRNLEVNGNATNCKFRAPDGVFWDISDIQKPLIALREEDLNDETAQSETNRAFYMFGWFDEQGSLRSNDMGKIDATNKADLEKLYDFINGKTKTSLGEIASGEEKPKSFLDDCDKIDDTHYNCGGTTFIPKTGNGACVNITTGPLKGTQSCGPDENTTVWVPENPIKSNIYGADAKSDENCATSTYGACRTFGDYYKTAKSYCESRGTHIATAGELISLGYTNGYFWTSDENDSDQPYTLRGRFVDTNYTKGHKGNDIVCVGN